MSFDSALKSIFPVAVKGVTITGTNFFSPAYIFVIVFISAENNFCTTDEVKETPTVAAENFCKKDRRENPFILSISLTNLI
jgi:hypothetical protein